MARVYGPLHSLEARGGFASQLIFQNQRGKAVVKRWAKPSNPKTLPQTNSRTFLAALATSWKQIGTDAQLSWALSPLAANTDPYHAFVTDNMQRWRTGAGTRAIYPWQNAANADGITLTNVTVANGQATVQIHLEDPIFQWIYGIGFREATDTPFSPSQIIHLEAYDGQTEKTFVIPFPLTDPGVFYSIVLAQYGYGEYDYSTRYYYGFDGETEAIPGVPPKAVYSVPVIEV